MKKIKLFQAVLFDADGTLYDSTMLHFEAYHKAIWELCSFDFTEKLFFDEVIGNYKKPPQIMKELGIPCDKDEFYVRKRKYYQEIAAKKLNPTQGLVPFLEILQKHKIPCGIVSGASSNSLEDSLNILKISRFFDHKITFEDCPEQQKPHSLPYEIALKKMNINPAETLAFEDTKSGIESAQAASLFCIGIKNTTNTSFELQKAKMIIQNYDDLKYQIEKGLTLEII